MTLTIRPRPAHHPLRKRTSRVALASRALTVALISPGLISCAMRKTASSPQEFTSSQNISTETLALNIPALTKADVNYTATRTQFIEGGDGALTVNLGKITAQQCAALKSSLYDNGITCASRQGLDYDMTDFLPPMVQALNGKTFYNESHVTVGEDRNYRQDVDSNCWGTAYEFQRRSRESSYELFYADGDVVNAILASPNNSTKLAEITAPEQLDALAPSLKLGDYLLIYDPIRATHLVHAAVYMNGDVFFQKFSVSAHPLGLVTFSDLFKRYTAKPRGGGGASGLSISRFELRRLTVAPSRLPDPKTLPNVTSRTVSFRINNELKTWELNESVAPPEASTQSPSCEDVVSKPRQIPAGLPPRIHCENNHYDLAIENRGGEIYEYKILTKFGSQAEIPSRYPWLYLQTQTSETLSFYDRQQSGSVTFELWVNDKHCVITSADGLNPGGRSLGPLRCQW